MKALEWKRREETDGEVNFVRFGGKLDIRGRAGEEEEREMSSVHLK